jgi:ParB-like chromosome segregation protein Spo0J
MTEDHLSVHDVSAASLEMNEQEFRALKESIAAMGQIYPILTLGAVVYDGRKRLRACRELGIEPKIVDVGSAIDPADIAAAANLLRTHYSASQRALFASRLANLKHGGDRRTDQAANLPLVSQRQAAQRFGVSNKSVIEAKRLEREAAPEILAAVERGELTVYGASRLARATPREDQAAALVQAPRRGKKKVIPITGRQCSPASPRQPGRNTASLRDDDCRGGGRD